MIDGHGWRREREVSKGPGRNGKNAGEVIVPPQNRAAAIRAKLVSDATAFIADPRKFGCLTFH